MLVVNAAGLSLTVHTTEVGALALAEALTGAVADAVAGRRKLDEAYEARRGETVGGGS